MKKRWIVIGIIILIFLFIGLFCYSRDNIRFKISYEYINNIELTNGKKIKVSIPLDNRVKYLNASELIDLLENGTGILYFGYNTCPWCRNSVPVLIDTAIENDIDNIYYVDVHSVKLDNKVYKLLDNYLSEDDEGNKRLAVPNVFAVKKGKIISNHVGTVDSYHNPYKGMNDTQKKELKDIYNKMMKEIK